MNMARTEQLGYGTQIAYLELTEDLLLEKMNQVLTERSYAENVAKISQRFKDQPQKPMERAIYWIEYVLRNENLDYMRTSAQHLYGFQYYNIDAYALITLVIVAAIMIPILVVGKACKFIKNSVCGSSQAKKKIN